MMVISMWVRSKRWVWRQLQGQVHMCVRTWDDCEHAVKAVGGPKKRGEGGRTHQQCGNRHNVQEWSAGGPRLKWGGPCEYVCR